MPFAVALALWLTETCNVLGLRNTSELRFFFCCFFISISSPQRPFNFWSQHGSGYLLDIRVESGQSVEFTQQFVSNLFGQAPMDEQKDRQGDDQAGIVLSECFGGSLRYKVSIDLVKQCKLSTVFDALQNERLAGRIKDYNLSQTTLDQVFVSFAKRQEYLT